MGKIAQVHYGAGKYVKGDKYDYYTTYVFIYTIDVQQVIGMVWIKLVMFTGKKT